MSWSSCWSALFISTCFVCCSRSVCCCCWTAWISPCSFRAELLVVIVLGPDLGQLGLGGVPLALENAQVALEPGRLEPLGEQRLVQRPALLDQGEEAVQELVVAGLERLERRRQLRDAVLGVGGGLLGAGRGGGSLLGVSSTGRGLWA